MATILRELGFAVKGHMSVLDEADQMMVVGRLEAQGLKATEGGSATSTATKGPKKLMKKKALPSGDAKKLVPKKSLSQMSAAAAAAEPAAAETFPTAEPSATTTAAPTEAAEAVAAAETTPAVAEKAEAPAVEAEPTVVDQPEPTATAAPETQQTTSKGSPQSAAAAPADAGPADAVPAVAGPADAGPADAAPTVAEPAEAAPTVAGPADAAPTDAGPADAAAAAPGTETPVEPKAPAAATADTGVAKTPAKPTPAPKVIKRLIKPELRAKVMGKIQLPESTIRDANRRSAPRDPGSVDHALRMKALTHTQSRSATRTGTGQRRGPGTRGGPRGRGRDQGRGQRRRSGSVGISTTIDPDKLIEIEPPITVKGLSEALGVKVSSLIATLTFKMKVAGKTINSFLDPDEVELVAIEIGRNIKIVERKEAEEQLLETLVSASEDIQAFQRAPVLTFMGHVDHGKTTLLDALRRSDVVKGEAGGITQHIGAYKITTEAGQQFVILDTPGHAAFTSMRARGASLTDIVVLVVAADDGVMPQTEEAVNHAIAAKSRIVVAVNKCDSPGAKPDQVRQQLSVKGLQAEEWGGEVQMVNVSALTREGLDELIEKVLLEAELLELQAKPDAPGSGVVVESRQSAEQGIVVNVLVNDGTLRVRDMVICGESFARVRGMVDDHGQQCTEAGPATPVSIIGLTKLPSPGDKFFVVEDAKKAKEVAEDRQRRSRANDLADRSRVTVENLAAKLRDQEIDEINVILKADVMGSLEPLRTGLAEIGTDEVRVNVIHKGLGAVTETDVGLAEASNAIIIGFNTVPDPAARQAADRANVEIRYYDIIYKLLDEMRLALEGMLKPEEVEEIEGHAEIRAIFKSSKFGNISGCFVTDGLVTRNHNVRLSRGGRVVFRGKIGSLRRVDDDVREVKADYECGLTIANFNDVKIEDELEFFTVKFIPRKLDG